MSVAVPDPSRGPDLQIPGRGSAVIGVAQMLRTRLARFPIGRVAFAASAVGMAFFVVRLLMDSWLTKFAPSFPDSFSYLKVAKKGPLRPVFFFDERPILYPFVQWMFGRNIRVLVLAQSGAYVAAWMALFLTALRCLRSRVIACTAVSAFALLGMQSRFAQWQTLTLSESLSNTLVIATIAAWWRCAHARGRRGFGWAMAFTVSWMLVRDGNVIPVGAVAVTGAAVVLAWRHGEPALRKRLLAGAMTVFVVAGYVYVAQRASQRNRYPLNNNVGQRILTDPALTKWFVAGGMPLDDALRARVGKDSWADGEAFLRAPELERYRTWARGAGQRRLVLSMAVRSPDWIKRLRAELPVYLRMSYADYDSFRVGTRLPDRPLGGWVGPRTVRSLQLWTLAAVIGCAIAVARRRVTGGGVVWFAALGLAAGFVDLYASYVGDSVEAGRHVIGALLRISAALIVAVAIGADALVAKTRTSRAVLTDDEPGAPASTSARSAATDPGEPGITGDERRPWQPLRAHHWVGWLTVGAFVFIAMAAFFNQEFRSQDYDPQYMRNIVERTIRYGGTYYENGIHNKGPLEPVVYHLAARLTSYNGYWYAISAFIICVTIAIGHAASRAARFTGGNRRLGLAAAAAVFVHFTLSSADYAGVLYSRNITLCLLVSAFSILLAERPWTDGRIIHPRVSAVAVGVLLGLVFQTLITAVLSSGVIVLFAAAMLRDRFPADRARALSLTLIGSAGITFLAAPFWYALRGAWTPFWHGWWVYGTYMSRSTGRSLASQLGMGWQQLYRYYQLRPLGFGVIALFAVVSYAGWHRFSRRAKAFHGALLAWLAAGWLEIVLTQRYSSHYFSVTSVPTALMAAALAGHGQQLLTRSGARLRAVVAWPLVVTCAAVYLSGPTEVVNGLRTASKFQGVDRAVNERAAGMDGSARTVRAVLDLVSKPDDPLLMWTNVPWPYLLFRRVSATRFIWKSFLAGETYLGRTSPDYILPDSWALWRQDLERTRPIAFVEEASYRLTPGTVAEAFINAEFRRVYTGPELNGAPRARVDLRKDAADALLLSSAATPWVPHGVPLGDSGWKLGADLSSLTYQRGVRSGGDDLAVIATDSCLRLEGTLSAPPGSDPSGFGKVVFRFDDNAGQSERLRLALEGDQAASGSDFVGYEQVPTGAAPGTPIPFALVVGRRSAVLIVNAQVRAAVRLPKSVTVTAEPRSAALAMSALKIGKAPAGSGCD